MRKLGAGAEKAAAGSDYLRLGWRVQVLVGWRRCLCLVPCALPLLPPHDPLHFKSTFATSNIDLQSLLPAHTPTSRSILTGSLTSLCLSYAPFQHYPAALYPTTSPFAPVIPHRPRLP